MHEENSNVVADENLCRLCGEVLGGKERTVPKTDKCLLAAFSIQKDD